MKALILFLLLLNFGTFHCVSQIPKIGDSIKLEIANWNLEWFGKTGYGPSDEVLQQANILKVIQNSDIDIWTFCEVSNNAAFDSMMIKLPAYDYKICTYLPEQKTAVIFKKNEFRLLSSGLLGTSNSDSFTTLRFPFQVVLKPLIPIGIDTLTIIALHLKANIGTATEKLNAYNSRMRSGEWLKMYLNKTQINRKCIVLGDWNDDLDESIFNNLPSPYAALLYSDFKFQFISKKFTDAHVGTTTGYTDAIDHQLISLPLEDFLVKNSTSIFYLNQYISNYSNTTSDHYPVYSIFNRNSSATYNYDKFAGILLYPNPALSKIYINCNSLSENSIIKIISMTGENVLESEIMNDTPINVSSLIAGYYQVIIINGSNRYIRRLAINQ